MPAQKSRLLAGAAFLVSGRNGLLSDSELFFGDDGAVAADVFPDQVVKQTAALADKLFKGAGRSMIFVI